MAPKEMDTPFGKQKFVKKIIVGKSTTTTNKLHIDIIGCFK